MGVVTGYNSSLGEARAGTQVKGIGGVLITELLPKASQPAFLTENQLPRSGTVHDGLGPPTTNSNQGSAPRTCPQINLMETISQSRLLF